MIFHCERNVCHTCERIMAKLLIFPIKIFIFFLAFSAWTYMISLLIFHYAFWLSLLYVIWYIRKWKKTQNAEMNVYAQCTSNTFVPARTSQVYQRCSLGNLHKFSLFNFFEEIDIFPPGTIDCEDSGMSNYPGNNYKPLIGLTHKKALHRKVVTINLQDGNCACPSIIDHLLDI